MRSRQQTVGHSRAQNGRCDTYCCTRPTQAHSNGAMQTRHGLISPPVVDPSTALKLNRGIGHHSKCFDSEFSVALHLMLVKSIYYL